jgi:hypothetical protein
MSKVQDWKFRERGATEFFCNKSCAMHHKRNRPDLKEVFLAGSKKGQVGFADRCAKARAEGRYATAYPEVRERLSLTLKKIGHKPSIQGGNGRGLSYPQALLLERLGEEWVAEYAEKTGQARGSGYPRHYKIDIAHLAKKIAVEVDGPSHQLLTRKAQDRKKEDFLRSLGWTVLRLSNRRVMEHLEACAQEVLSTTSR